MVRRTQTEREWPSFPLGPVLIEYGGEDVMEDRGWYAYKCPFHGDRSASASVNTILNVFVCHTCEMKGNAVQLVMKKENIPYGDAVAKAKEICGSAGQVKYGQVPASRTNRRSGSRALRRTWK